MQLELLAQALAPTEIVNAAAVDIADLAYDTRAVAPGALFFCVRGSRSDGHDLAADAVARGAAALVVERALDLCTCRSSSSRTRGAQWRRRRSPSSATRAASSTSPP